MPGSQSSSHFAPASPGPQIGPQNANAGPAWWRLATSPKGELAASLIAGALLLAGFLVGQAGHQAPAAAMYWSSLAIGLVHGVRAAWESLAERRFDIDVLMVVGAVLAAVLDAPAEGALLLFLFVLSGALEALAMARTTRAVEALHKLMPTHALRWTGEGAADAGDRGEWVEAAPETLRTGDIVKVLPGELIPADASVIDGRTSVNQANLTGESMPRSVRAGDEVFAGTINVGNPVRLRVSRPAQESSLQKVLDLVISAQQQREPVQRFIDRVSQPYAVGVTLVSAAVLFIWWLALGAPFKDALYTAITLLIVASPCAVIIATPTATLAAIARGARAGVLFKGGQSIERLAGLRAVAFDKTGTLTVGRPVVRALHAVGWSDESRLLAVAAGLEQDSTHPIAAAVREAARARAVTPARVDHPTFTPGRGVGGQVEDVPARLGTFVHTQDLIPVCLRARIQQVLETVQGRGQIGTVVAHDQQAGVVILSDTVRPGADTLVRQMHALGVRPVVMLTGDNRATAQAVATSLGLDRFQAEMLPQDKLAAVQGLKDEVRGAGRAGMFAPAPGAGVIGDGVNDAPALAAADVSIAIGSVGSDAALESADIVLLADDLRMVPWAVGLARRTRRTIVFNLCFALGAILIMAAATLVGSRIGRPLPLWLGVIGHEGGTLLVVLNSLLLLVHPAVKGVVEPRADQELDPADSAASAIPAASVPG